jgi:hypothetical protein
MSAQKNGAARGAREPKQAAATIRFSDPARKATAEAVLIKS